jgi:hypothetical protein
MALKLDKNEVREYLINLAKQRKTCGYKELAEDIVGKGSYTIGNHDGKVVAHTAGEVSKDEARENHPLLSALIVNQATNLPGGGFFKLAKDLGLFHGDVDSAEDQRQYTKYEHARIYNYWSTVFDASDDQEVALINQDFDAAIPEEKERVVKQIERGSVASKVKAFNGYKCQVCEALEQNPFSFLKSDDTPYVEAHHVMPVNTREKGVLSARNIITVCANHHRQMHYGDVELIEDEGDIFVFKIDGQEIEINKVKLAD